MSGNEDAMPGRTETLIPLVRKSFGDTVDIHADANSSYDPAEAIRVGRMLQEIGAVHFEEPCEFDHLDETKAVADALTIPVACGEQEFSHWRFRSMIANRGADVLQPDLHYYGGMIRSIRVARMAQVAGLPISLHISGGFGFVYMLQFASGVQARHRGVRPLVRSRDRRERRQDERAERTRCRHQGRRRRAEGGAAGVAFRGHVRP
jgi:L-alanine-DL-glutamate epimerase-like enolase superfamily enzyme